MGIYERKQREKERRRKDITTAARKVFSIKGFNAATMEKIAFEAQLSPGISGSFFFWTAHRKDRYFVFHSYQLASFSTFSKG